MTEAIEAVGDDLLEHVSHIVSAYVSHNSLPPSELAAMIASVHGALQSIKTGASGVTSEPEKLEPAVSVRRSVQNDYIVCLEDGKKFKSLRRHLNAAYGMTPEAYRAKWNLPNDYPMVAPGYAKVRSELAKSIGLGRKVEPKSAKPSSRGRKKAAA